MYNSRQIIHNFKEMLDKAEDGESIYFRRGKHQFVIRRDDKDQSIQVVLDRIKRLEAKVDSFNMPAKAEEEKLVQFAQEGIKTMDQIRSEKPCCSSTPRCQHWSWDIQTGDGYVNSLSGRVREE